MGKREELIKRFRYITLGGLSLACIAVALATWTMLRHEYLLFAINVGMLFAQLGCAISAIYLRRKLESLP